MSKPMALETLHLLRRVLASQQLNVGDPDFAILAQTAATALIELDVAIADHADHAGTER